MPRRGPLLPALFAGIAVLVIGVLVGLSQLGSPTGGGLPVTFPSGDGTEAAPVASAPPALSGRSYAVRPGDTLGGIAAAHDTTVEALAAANGLSVPYLLQLGQVLRIPQTGDGESPPEPTPDDLLALIDKQHSLSPGFIPADLQPLQRIPSIYAGLRLRAVAVGPLSEMIAAAASRGHDIQVVSAFRSYEDQDAIFRREVSQSGEREAERYVARPGHSEHQLGTAVDVSGASVGFALDDRLGSRPDGIWLRDNAHQFGFVMSYPAGKEGATGYAYEPWHFRYVGVDLATTLNGRGLTLTEYLRSR